MVLNCELEIDAGTRLTTTVSLRVLMVSFVVGFITDGGLLGLCSGFVRDSFGIIVRDAKLQHSKLAVRRLYGVVCDFMDYGGDRERTRLKPADLREVKDVIMFKNHIF